MPNGLDLAAELAHAFQGRERAWAFIRRFAAEWANPLLPGDGHDVAELDAAEERLGLRLPAALREAYALVGPRDDLTGNQDHLLPPKSLYVDETGEALVYRLENQHVVEWGIPLAELDRDDPPTVFRWDMLDKEAERWAPWIDRLSAAFVEIVMSESLFADEDLSGNRGLDPETVAALETRYALAPFPGYPADDPATRWFFGPDALLRDDGRSWLWVRARTPEAMDDVRHALPGMWCA
ncbi:SMI1/KNR4 family protein [Microtetraspora malaysiensis]|uniref:SMI1/KNR4 family protein n=1 Tax=Microtetraspora malaysiensis TaxID=161358 RepID=A0ABW6SYB2_9ACTN